MKKKNDKAKRVSQSQEPLNSEQIALFHKKVARKVVAVRTAKGIYQLELSLTIGYKSVSLVAGAETGYKNIHFNLEQLYRIAHALEVDIEEFFKDE